jgi:hypothetical protein
VEGQQELCWLRDEVTGLGAKNRRESLVLSDVLGASGPSIAHNLMSVAQLTSMG